MPDIASESLLPFEGSFHSHLSLHFPTLVGRNDDLRIEIGPGWVCPVCELLQVMEAAARSDSEFKLLQIKEKFGTLRVHYVPHRDAIDKEIEKADAICQSRCEVCGAPTDLTPSLHEAMAALCHTHSHQSAY